MPTVKEICDAVQISQQTFYRLARTNGELKAIISREKQGAKRDSNGYNYSDAVITWLQTRYPAQKPSGGSEMPSEAMQARQEIESLREQIRALEAERGVLKAQLDEKEKRCAELEADKGQLFRALAEAQAGEKEMRAQVQALLPAPRKTLRQIIAAAFGRKSQDTEGEKR